MSVHDFLDRRADVRAGGRVFVLRSISVLGFFSFQQIVVEASKESDVTAWLDMRAAAVTDADEADALLAGMYTAILDRLGVDVISRVFSLLCENGEPALIASALREDPDALRTFFLAISRLHDLPRLLRRMTRVATDEPERPTLMRQDPDAPRVGIETAVVQVCLRFPAYTFTDVLAWPYERLLSVQDQVRLLSNPEALKPKETTNASLAAAGFRVHAPPKPVVN